MGFEAPNSVQFPIKPIRVWFDEEGEPNYKILTWIYHKFDNMNIIIGYWIQTQTIGPDSSRRWVENYTSDCANEAQAREILQFSQN